MATLNIYETFISIDGEVNLWGQGKLSHFIRLAGCNMNCSYCDTPQARIQGNGGKIEVGRLIENMITFHNGYPKKITITGGEPLLQQEGLTQLLKQIPSDIKISIETNGTVIPSNELLFELAECSFIVDYKSPHNFNMAWIEYLDQEDDWIKFPVICEEEVHQVISLIKSRPFSLFENVAISPIESKLGKLIVDELVRHKLWHVSVNVQIHKQIGVK